MSTLLYAQQFPNANDLAAWWNTQITTTPASTAATAGSRATYTITTAHSGGVAEIATIKINAISGAYFPAGVSFTVTPGGPITGAVPITYTTGATDTPTTIATALTAALNANSAWVDGTTGLTITSSTDTITLTMNTVNVASGDSVTSHEVDTITITAVQVGTKFNALIGGTHNVFYQAVYGDTPSTVAAGLAAAINADTNWTSAATITVSGTVITIVAKTANTALTITTTRTTVTLALVSEHVVVIPYSPNATLNTVWTLFYTQA